jgi:predicted nucleotidyltransferase
MNLDENNIDKIVDFLIKNINPYLIYLFGSSINGIFRKDSDIDIAFMSDEEITDYQVFMMAQELADMLKREVDLINLKNASTVFKAQILGKGERIYCSDNERRMYFEMYALKDYALLNEEREIILKSIKQRGHIYE